MCQEEVNTKGKLWWHEVAQQAGLNSAQLASGEDVESEQPEPEREAVELEALLEAVTAEAAMLSHSAPSEPVDEALAVQTACFTALADFEDKVASRLGKPRFADVFTGYVLIH
jgi:hypothetical protein